MRKTIIIQSHIPEYRVAFFNKLNVKLKGKLVVCSGEVNEKLHCEQHKMHIKRCFGFVLCHDLPQFSQYSRVIVPFDLRWLLLYHLLLFHNNKIILWGHGVGKHKVLILLRALLVNISNGLVTYEPGGVRDFRKLGVPEKKLAFKGNTQEVENHCLTQGAKDSFIFVGRLQERKGLLEIVYAFSKLSPNIRRIHKLIFVGNGVMQPIIQAEIKKLGLITQCMFVPTTYDINKLKDLFSESLAYISPNHVGLGVLNAFAYGVPVITHKERLHAPEVENIQDGVNGFLTDGTVSGLTEAMNEYATNKKKAREHANNAYTHYTKNRKMDMMVERYFQAIKGFVV